jgi:UrcA family protein
MSAAMARRSVIKPEDHLKPGARLRGNSDMESLLIQTAGIDPASNPLKQPANWSHAMNTYDTSATARGFYLNRTLAAVAATLLTAVWLAAAQPAHADTVVATARVNYADLNLRSEAGARALYRRLQRAAERVCDDAGRHSRASRECYETALADAVNSIGAPKLVELHRAHAAGASHSG